MSMTTFQIETEDLPEGWLWTGDAIVMLRCLTEDEGSVKYSMRCVGSVKNDFALALGMTMGFEVDIRQQWLDSLSVEGEEEPDA